MPRRYPRLVASDARGNIVGIPLSIAPRLLPHERFVALSQEKVLQIAEANERLKRVENEDHTQPRRLVEVVAKKPEVLPVKKRENEGSTITKTASRDNTPHEKPGTSTTVTPTNSDDNGGPALAGRAFDSDSDTEISVPSSESKKLKRFWTEDEDEIVLCAVLMKEPGRVLLERLPHRSKSAVFQRYYMLRERHEAELEEEARERERSRGTRLAVVVKEEGLEREFEEDEGEEDGVIGDEEMSVELYIESNGNDSDGESVQGEDPRDINFSSDEDMDEIPPL